MLYLVTGPLILFDHLVYLAANASVIHNDDTSARILALYGKPPRDEDGIDKKRTGMSVNDVRSWR